MCEFGFHFTSIKRPLPPLHRGEVDIGGEEEGQAEESQKGDEDGGQVDPLDLKAASGIGRLGGAITSVRGGVGVIGGGGAVRGLWGAIGGGGLAIRWGRGAIGGGGSGV